MASFTADHVDGGGGADAGDDRGTEVEGQLRATAAGDGAPHAAEAEHVEWKRKVLARERVGGHAEDAAGVLVEAMNGQGLEPAIGGWQ